MSGCMFKLNKIHRILDVWIHGLSLLKYTGFKQMIQGDPICQSDNVDERMILEVIVLKWSILVTKSKNCDLLTELILKHRP